MRLPRMAYGCGWAHAYAPAVARTAGPCGQMVASVHWPTCFTNVSKAATAAGGEMLTTLSYVEALRIPFSGEGRMPAWASS